MLTCLAVLEINDRIDGQLRIENVPDDSVGVFFSTHKQKFYTL